MFLTQRSKVCVGRTNPLQIRGVRRNATTKLRRSSRLKVSQLTEPEVGQKKPFGYWNDKSNQRKHLELIGEELGVKRFEDWYKVSPKEVRVRANFIKYHYNTSLYRALKEIYPEYEWDVTQFQTRVWTDSTFQRQRLDEIGKELGVNTLDDWYKIPAAEVRKRATFIGNHYNSSVITALTAIYPEHNWDVLKFTSIPRGYWDNECHRRQRFDEILHELGGVKSPSLNTWYRISRTQAYKKAKFLHRYKLSLTKALTVLYPEHNWDVFKFTKTPHGTWKDVNNRRARLQRLAAQLKLKNLDGWYKLTATEVRKHASFLSYYKNSLIKALRRLYPQHTWNTLKFHRVPHRFWKKASTRRKMKQVIKDIIAKYKIVTIHDWYSLPREQYRIYHRISKNLFGGKEKMLRKWFPYRAWADDVSSSSPERKIRNMLEVLTRVESHTIISGYSTDIYLPEYSIVIEFQGPQHYIPRERGNFQYQVDRDRRKREAVQRQGIHFIEIPYWWNQTWSQLLITIKQHLQGIAHPLNELTTERESTTSFPFVKSISMNEASAVIDEDTTFFREIKRDGFIVYNYLQDMPSGEFVDKAKQVFMELHPKRAANPYQARLWSILHECRGLKFSPEGKILCRPFHKFWNINETSDSKLSNINMDNIEVVLEKLDGQLIAPIRVNDKILFVSKNGNSVRALNRHITFALNNKNIYYTNFAASVIENNQTAIFEYISVNKPYVIRYKKQQLVLLAIRDNITGEYMNHWSMKKLAAEYNVPVVADWPIPKDKKGLKNLKKVEGVEGFIIKMRDGRLFKLKTDWYWHRFRVSRHKIAKSLRENEAEHVDK